MFHYRKLVKSWQVILFIWIVFTLFIVIFYGELNERRKSRNYFSHVQKGLPLVHDIFFGVITCENYAETYAKAVFQTWGKLVEPSMLRFFSDSPHATIPTVVTPKIDITGVNKKLKTNYQKRVAHKERYFREESNRSLQMFAWAWDHVPQAKWFYKCDDDSFVRVELLQEILRQFDHTKPLYIGSTRRFQGKLVPVLERDASWTRDIHLRYAMGGAGYVLSRGLLEKWRPWMNQCIVYNGEDKNIAKCILDTLHIEPINLPGLCFVHPDKVDSVSRDSVIAFHQIRGMEDSMELFRRFYLDRNRYDSGGDAIP
ncbi:Chondroitin sulfate synthase 1 [Galdieria sulphuraria]|uniref:N-acetylgalactosaminide beta-1,3-galactosyltransferase n=1 Tax=Galdieria sulphuraria TaxID=130081 RepID=M2XJ15_GALSU|nr:uncharacterized protein Gasu_24800 [Galdieria sulphuraria]EME30097.1 hypothetical protein Gasu_24800 [Galdieria sulphuraria]GJD11561.1 Chondroitin sulfate synthase 1 [Galdieria sulphuraria]|eukprot:XP_005706617.1 hypothetical protein Gasu_24800 [Galdieria sulphuraria]